MECGDRKKTDKQTLFSYLRENLPLIIIIVFGILILGWIWWVWALIYFGYSLTALLLYMKFVCLYCLCYKTRSCHDGYHIIASRLFKPRKGKHFYSQFKRFVPVVYPIWFLPVPGAIYTLITKFSWLYLGFVIIFSISGFIILPLLSQHQCNKCKNATFCPRMVKQVDKKAQPIKDLSIIIEKKTIPGKISTYQ